MTNTLFSFPMRYLPKHLSRKDKQKQAAAINRSRNLYSRQIYYTRPPVKSFQSKPSSHVTLAKQLYGVKSLLPTNPALATKTGCSVRGLKQIVRKGEGAYYSSGSRPNQTAHSWGIARLASAITSGKAAAVDFSILDKECNHAKRAYKLATQAVKKHGDGRRHKTRKRQVRL